MTVSSSPTPPLLSAHLCSSWLVVHSRFGLQLSHSSCSKTSLPGSHFMNLYQPFLFHHCYLLIRTCHALPLLLMVILPLLFRHLTSTQPHFMNLCQPFLLHHCYLLIYVCRPLPLWLTWSHPSCSDTSLPDSHTSWNSVNISYSTYVICSSKLIVHSHFGLQTAAPHVPVSTNYNSYEPSVLPSLLGLPKPVTSTVLPNSSPFDFSSTPSTPTARTQVKLLKLTLKKFSGDLTQFGTPLIQLSTAIPTCLVWTSSATCIFCLTQLQLR